MNIDNNRPRSMAHGIMRRLARRMVLIMGTVMALGLAGCIDTNSQCIEDQPGYQEGRDVWLTFDIRNVDETGSRAVSDPVHPDEDASAAENYINCEDYDLTVMYLNEQGRVMKVFNRDEYIVIRDAGDATDCKYKLTLRINQDYFSSVGDNVTFSLLVIANLNGTADGGSYGLNWMATLSELSNLKTSFGYTGVNGTEAWQPDIAAKRFIPMAGVRQFSISRAALTAATDKENEFDLSADNNAIDMQRAMAKIRVVDALAANGDTDNKIIAVTLSGMNTRGTYLPEITANAWGPNTAVCHTAKSSSGWFGFTADNEARPTYTVTKNNRECRELYIPEFSWTETAGAEPTLNITLQSKSGETRVYKYPVSKTLKPEGTTGIDMARNHIYEFVVTEVAGTELELTLNVKDWEDHETVWDYTDNPGLATGGAIQFDENTCTVRKETADVIFRNDQADIKAKFTLAVPVNATWRAVFVHESGTQGAFVFVDKNGNEVETVSGNIDGITPAELIIRTKDTPKEINNVKRLQIIVQMADGRSVTADVLQGGGYGSGKSFITITQNHQIQ